MGSSETATQGFTIQRLRPEHASRVHGLLVFLHELHAAYVQSLGWRWRAPD